MADPYISVSPLHHAASVQFISSHTRSCEAKKCLCAHLKGSSYTMRLHFKSKRSTQGLFRSNHITVIGLESNQWDMMAINAAVLFLQDKTGPNQPGSFWPICSFWHQKHPRLRLRLPYLIISHTLYDEATQVNGYKCVRYDSFTNPEMSVGIIPHIP